jgi:chromosome segregation ATPase
VCLSLWGSVEVYSFGEKEYIALLRGDLNSVNPLVQQLQIVHGKQREFNTQLITVLTREALLQQAGLRKSHTELIKEKDKVDKKWKAAEEKLKEQREDINKLDQLKKDNVTNLKLLDDSQNHVETLQQQLREAENYNANGNQIVKDLEEKIKILESEHTTAKDNEFQLKKALDIKEKHISAVEANSLEANNTLESEKEELENNLTAGQKQIETLSSQITALKLEN